MTPFSSNPTLSPSLTDNFFWLAIHLPWGPKRAVRGDPVQRPHNSDIWAALLASSLHRAAVLYLTRSGRGAMVFSVPGLGRRDWWLSRARMEAKQRKAKIPRDTHGPSGSCLPRASSDLRTRTDRPVRIPLASPIRPKFEQKNFSGPRVVFSWVMDRGKGGENPFCCLARRGGLREGSGNGMANEVAAARFLFHVFNCGEGE